MQIQEGTKNEGPCLNGAKGEHKKEVSKLERMSGVTTPGRAGEQAALWVK